MSKDEAATKKSKTRFRIIAVVVWAVIMAAAIAYMTAGSGSSPPPPAAIKRCEILVTAKGINVDGHESNVGVAVELCRRAGGAEVHVGSDARRTDVLQLQGALTNARIDVLTHGLK
jgi:hypothetical protein